MEIHLNQTSFHLESFSTENLEQDHHEIAEELEMPMVDLINFEEGQDEEPRGCEEIVVELEELRIILARELDVGDDLEDDPVPIDQNVFFIILLFKNILQR